MAMYKQMARSLISQLTPATDHGVIGPLFASGGRPEAAHAAGAHCWLFQQLE